jgi:arsenate reductase
MIDKKTILVLCTGNSCRSQMAEGYLRHFAGHRFDVYSAGVEPKDRVHPLAVKVMAEDGVDISNHEPKDAEQFLGEPIAFLIIVCHRANESCPRAWPGILNRLYWPFDDPVEFRGSQQETFAEFCRVRDEIKEKIQTWLESDAK